MRELTLFLRRRYARFMMHRMTVTGLLLLTCLAVPEFLPAKVRPAAFAIPEEDYGLYDRVVTKKFLTSQTQLVVLERMTVSRILPNQKEPTTIAFFDEQGYFNGTLPLDLVRDFVEANQEPGRLEARFQFGVGYRFVSGNPAEEEPEVVSALPVKAGCGRPTRAPSVLDRLAFSRLGRTLRNDQALLYVEHVRPDGTGAGFLVWFRRQELDWTIADTDVIWTARDEDNDEAP
jgi:hypothetical protein